MTRHQVVVVGAGPAGLATAAQLQRAGLSALVLDRAATVGSAWRTRYDSFRLHTIRWLSGLPGLPIPKALGPWVSRDDFLGYLQRYAEHFDLRPRFGTELQGLARSGDGWRLSTSDGDLDAERVVLATGAYNEPRIPAWEGRATLRPPLIHSSEYRRPDLYAGSRVLVVGSGNSGTEIAVDLAASGRVDVELAVRTPPNIISRDLHGVPTQPIGIALRRVPTPLADPLVAVMRRLTVPDLTDRGLPAPRAPYSQFRRTHTIPVLDHGFINAVRTGRITVRTGVARLEGDEVVHEDGSRSRPDAVIAGTGYETGLTPILGPHGLVDGHGLPTVGSRGDAAVPSLYTVGISLHLAGVLREIGLDSRRVARAVAAT